MLKFRWETGTSAVSRVLLKENCVSIQYGYTQSAAREKVGPKFLRITDIQNRIINWKKVPYCKINKEDYERHKLEDGDIVIARTGASTGTNAIYLKKMPEAVFASYLIRVKVNSKLVPLFVYYFLQSHEYREYIESIVGGSAQPNANAQQLTDVLVPILPLPEQEVVACILSSLDDLIAIKKQQNDILEKTAIAIFKSWFIDFEPFSDGEFVDSDLGKIPKKWEIGKLSNMCEIIMGQSPPSEYYNEEGEGHPFIQGKGQFGRYTPNTNIYCSTTGKIAKPNDVLLTVRAPIGELNIADAEYIIGRGLASLRSENWVFVYLYLLSNKELLKASERGTTFDAITKPELESFPVIKPPQEVLEKFKAITEPLFSKILLNQKQIWALSKVRDVLLPLLVFGKLRVEEI